MSFFDDLGKKASEAGAKAIQKTKELSDTTRLNSMISEEERKINNVCCQIGELYISLHRNDYESEFKEMIVSIKNSEEKIICYKKQIQDIKGIQRCIKCGAEIPKNSLFCSSCGAEVTQIQEFIENDDIICVKCGATVKKGMRFCTSCGTQVIIRESEDIVNMLDK